MKRGMLVLSMLLFATALSAQSVCLNNPGPFYVTSARPFTVEWVMDAMVPVSDTDPTLVPTRTDGYYYQIDSTSEVKILVADTIPGPACPVGTTHAGKIPYTWRAPYGVSKGSHTLKFGSWNYALDSNGMNTAVEQRSVIVTVPFVAIDPALIGAPPPPGGIIIKR